MSRKLFQYGIARRWYIVLVVLLLVTLGTSIGPSAALAGPATSELHQPLAASTTEPWAVVLCGANDITFSAGRADWFRSLLDNFDSYWKEQSYNQLSTAGGQVVGPYTLSQPSSNYWTKTVNGNFTSYYIQRDKVLEECLDAADGDLNFPTFTGIHIIFPAPDSYRSQTSSPVGESEPGSVELSYDNQTKGYGITYIPLQSPSHQYLAHEWSHGWGLMHSGGPYNTDYDSGWDVVSGARFGYPCTYTPDPTTFGCLGQHTIAYHKARLGWIPNDRIFTVQRGTRATITLAPLESLPTNPNAYLYVKLPIPLYGQYGAGFYTVEARQQVGYDKGVPANAIVMHRVDEFGGNYYPRAAQVVDEDGNGNPNDDAAQWLPGEVFSVGPDDIFRDDATNRVSVLMCVNSEQNGLYSITVAVDAGTSCSSTNPTATATNTNVTATATATNTAVPPTSTSTRTATATNTAVPPSSTSTRTATATNTPVPPTSTSTRTATATNTPVPPTSTSTNTATATSTTVSPSSTATRTPSMTPSTVPPSRTSTNTATATNTAVPPTSTSTRTPSMTPSTVPPSRTSTNTATATSTTVLPSSTATRTPSMTPSTVPPSRTSTNTATATNTAVSPSSTATRTATSVPASLAVIASADSYVQQKESRKNFGSKSPLIVDGTDDPREAYLRFTVSGVTGPVQKAVLRLYVTEGSKDGPRLYQAANSTWSESTLTWNNRPGAIGPLLGNIGKVNDKVWIEYDVTALVTGNGTYNFVLVGDSTESIEFTSREGSNKPQLVVTVQP